MQRAKSVALLHSKDERLETREKRWRGSDALQLAGLSGAKVEGPLQSVGRSADVTLDVIECRMSHV